MISAGVIAALLLLVLVLLLVVFSLRQQRDYRQRIVESQAGVIATMLHDAQHVRRRLFHACEEKARLQLALHDLDHLMARTGHNTDAPFRRRIAKALRGEP